MSALTWYVRFGTSASSTHGGSAQLARATDPSPMVAVKEAGMPTSEPDFSNMTWMRAAPSSGFARHGGFRHTGSGSPLAGIVIVCSTCQPGLVAATVAVSADAPVTGSGMSNLQLEAMDGASKESVAVVTVILSIGHLPSRGNPNAPRSTGTAASAMSMCAAGAITLRSSAARTRAPSTARS